LLLTFFSAKVENSNCSLSKKVTVVGIAENDKDAATVVVTGTYYYIVDGLDEWDEPC